MSSYIEVYTIVEGERRGNIIISVYPEGHTALFVTPDTQMQKVLEPDTMKKKNLPYLEFGD
jgi:hypothetical protein